MRVAIDCRIAHYTSGGTSTYARRLAEALLRSPEARADAWLILEARKAAAPMLSEYPAHASRASLFTPSHHRLEQWALPVELTALGHIDLIHSPDFIPPFRRRGKSVITVHDLAFLLWPEFLTTESRRYFNGQIGHAVESADAIVAVSEATRQDIIRLLGVTPEKVHAIHEAADPVFRPIADRTAVKRMLAEHSLPEDYVLFFGTREPRKNLPGLIRAFALVKERGYRGKLLLAGAPGWLTDAIDEEITSRRLEHDVILGESLPPGLLAHLYNGARLLAFPSIYEGFGLPILEAMACGTPVLTSNVSSMPEVAGGAALLVDPADHEAMAAGIWRILEDHELRTILRERGLARAAEFSWDRAAAETLAVYHRAA